MYGGTMDVLNYMLVGTRDTYVVEDKLIRLNIEQGTLILPNFYADTVQDWINRGILRAYGETPDPNDPGGPKIIINPDINPGRTTVTAVPAAGLIASLPKPLDGAAGVPASVVLGWRPGIYADTHDVYLGTNFNDVNDANKTNQLGVLVSEEQEANTYDPPGLLQLDTT